MAMGNREGGARDTLPGREQCTGQALASPCEVLYEGYLVFQRVFLIMPCRHIREVACKPLRFCLIA